MHFFRNEWKMNLFFHSLYKKSKLPTNKTMHPRTQRILQRLEKLGSISDAPNCLSRFYGTTAHIQSRKVLIEWMESAGMTVHCDNIGNVRGILKSKAPNAKHLVVASHYDSVFDAGKYDGPLGVLLGIEIAQQVSESGQDLPFHLQVVAFADEEGGRFNTAYLGSGVLAGYFDKTWLSRKDDAGETLDSVIQKMGHHIDLVNDEAIPKEDWLGYYEVHIEQGPVLCDKDLPVCLVSGIAGQTRVDIHWKGMAGHAGTSPMDLRQDALCAAAELTLIIEALGKKHKEKLVATVGKMIVGPNSSNVIPGTVYHTLDIRSMQDHFLAEMVAYLEQQALTIAKKRGLHCEWKVMQSNPSVDCDPQLSAALEKGIKKSGVRELLSIPSGAGHDGVMISKVAPISMLFVRCTDGISHNPAEYCSPEDIEAALFASDAFLEALADSIK